MGYALNAWVGSQGFLNGWDRDLASRAVTLPQGLQMLPITHEVFDHFGPDPRDDREDAFWFLHSRIATAARELSTHTPSAYLEANLFGGAGTQAAVVWSGGVTTWGPEVTAFEPAGPPPGGRSGWAFNQALRLLGVRAATGQDEFDTVGLGAHRSTEDWL